MTKKLKQNAKIAITAPAGRIFRKELDFALNWIKQNGWQFVLSEELFNQYDFGYFYSGTDEQRKKDLQQYLDNDEIDAIWFARGGYGSVKIIDELDFTQFKQNPKWLIGYSDITVFHNHLNNLGFPTLHAVTAKQLNVEYSEETYKSLLSVLKGEELTHKIPSHKLNILGTAKGKLVGGNLSIIYSLLGSNSFIQDNNLILFIEDWQENWYHLDRMLMALKRSGLFKRLNGVVVGSFTKMDVKDENPYYYHNFDKLSNQIIHSFFKDLNIPVMFNFPAGHIGDNRTLIMGSEIELNIDDSSASLTWN